MLPFQKAGFLASIGTMLVSCLYLAISLTREYGVGTGSVEYSIPVYGRWLMCLFSPVAFALGIDQVGLNECMHLFYHLPSTLYLQLPDDKADELKQIKRVCYLLYISNIIIHYKPYE